jgi:hypothetical protein
MEAYAVVVALAAFKSPNPLRPMIVGCPGALLQHQQPCCDGLEFAKGGGLRFWRALVHPSKTP